MRQSRHLIRDSLEPTLGPRRVVRSATHGLTTVRPALLACFVLACGHLVSLFPLASPSTAASAVAKPAEQVYRTRVGLVPFGADWPEVPFAEPLPPLPKRHSLASQGLDLGPFGGKTQEVHPGLPFLRTVDQVEGRICKSRFLPLSPPQSWRAPVRGARAPPRLFSVG